MAFSSAPGGETHAFELCTLITSTARDFFIVGNKIFICEEDENTGEVKYLAVNTTSNRMVLL